MATKPKVWVVRDQTMEARRQKAFEDYWSLGMHRTLNKLLTHYRRVAREEGAQAVPTLSRDQLYRWAKEDNWEARAKQRDREIYEQARKTIAEARTEGFRHLAELLPKALDVLERILTHPDDNLFTPSVRLRAAELVIQMANLKVVQDAETDKAQEQALKPPPPPSADIVDFDQYYRELVTKGR